MTTNEGGAWLSDDKVYRYNLYRRWDRGTAALWVMLNPSTADAFEDDATIRRCRSFSQREGHGAMWVVNLFAYRATHPEYLLHAIDPVGPKNLQAIKSLLDRGSITQVIFAWGAWLGRQGWDTRARHVDMMVRHAGLVPQCLGTNQDGSPKHPVRLAANTPLVAWS